MPHLHTGSGEHDFTASAYIVVRHAGEIKIWFHWHKKLEQWLQFGGHVELHEHPWATVVHELAEESGYALNQLQVLQPPTFLKPLTGAVLHPADVCINTHHFPNLDHYHTDITYAFLTEEEPRNQPQAGESTRLQLMSRAEILALKTEEIPESTREIALFIFDDIFPNWIPIDPTAFFISS